MSAISAGVIVTLLVLLLAVSVVIGGIAWSRTTSLLLPFPTSVSAITTLFPVVSLFIVVATNLFASRFERVNARRKRITASNGASNTTTTTNQTRSLLFPILTFILDNVFTILPTILATIAATYIAPSDNNCHLEQAWQAYYHNKDVNAIRTIQDRLQCCGLRSTRDRAWPFKDATHGDDACERSMGYTQHCLDPWSENERRVAVLVFAAAVVGWGIKLGFLYLGPGAPWTFNYNNNSFRRNTWTNGSGNGTGGSSAFPRLLPYTDNPREVVAERDEESPNSNNTTTGENPLLDADAHDVTSPDGRDLSGTGAWRVPV